MISCHSQTIGWKAKKIICSPSYADFRPKINTVILLDMGHMLRGEHIQKE
jgi:hypothetical protein